MPIVVDLDNSDSLNLANETLALSSEETTAAVATGLIVAFVLFGVFLVVCFCAYRRKKASQKERSQRETVQLKERVDSIPEVRFDSDSSRAVASGKRRRRKKRDINSDNEHQLDDESPNSLPLLAGVTAMCGNRPTPVDSKLTRGNQLRQRLSRSAQLMDRNQKSIMISTGLHMA